MAAMLVPGHDRDALHTMIDEVDATTAALFETYVADEIVVLFPELDDDVVVEHPPAGRYRRRAFAHDSGRPCGCIDCVGGF
jgi:hypothetical protein